jgi:hypothetical protein
VFICLISIPSIIAHILQIRRVPNPLLKQRQAQQAPLAALELGVLRRDEMILRVVQPLTLILFSSTIHKYPSNFDCKPLRPHSQPAGATPRPQPADFHQF